MAPTKKKTRSTSSVEDFFRHLKRKQIVKTEAPRAVKRGKRACTVPTEDTNLRLTSDPSPDLINN